MINKRKEVFVVGTVGLPACYGGFESLVDNLTLNTTSKYSYTVFCSKKNYDVIYESYNNSRLIYLPLDANGVSSIFYDILSLFICLYRKPDVVLILGVSGAIFLPFYKLFSRSKVITNIDGLEWKRDKWGQFTKRFLKFSERLAVKFSDVVVSDNQAITDYVREEYFIESQTIAYGGDHAIRQLVVDEKDSIVNYSLSICRVEPENNVDLILDAFSKTLKELKFVGNWDSSEFGRELKARFSIFPNIHIIDPVYDLDELFKLRIGCDSYIHGHSAGGTNPSLVEMMHFGKPILAFDCSFNRYSTEDKALFFSNSSDLLSLLNNNLISKIDGSQMKEIASRLYTWPIITRAYEAIYSKEIK
ncbi:DUF1972 domain-containing protein [Vibrio splendidus]|uniref:DUF1972 domain-containing protein n=1 Tax=Vibrio splendidus TaxID=29497 RepID=UPI00080DA07F|nr:DUF1972 domain-containing protein [Vibrio splendidus]OCH58779.1 glycosyl transferase [Vibrio splendidus]